MAKSSVMKKGQLDYAELARTNTIKIDRISARWKKVLSVVGIILESALWRSLWQDVAMPLFFE
jgi:hypothetical protein